MGGSIVGGSGSWVYRVGGFGRYRIGEDGREAERMAGLEAGRERAEGGNADEGTGARDGECIEPERRGEHRSQGSQRLHIHDPIFFR